MKIIGLTGPTGAGKSTLCEKIKEWGIPCINTDDIYHSIISYPSPCVKELQNTFGDSIIDEKGSLNRPALAKIVFEDPNEKESLQILNDITHKYIWEETQKIITQYANRGKKAVILDAPVLFSSKIFVESCTLIISVICDKEIRLERLLSRDGISKEQLLNRINAQPSNEFFVENSDYCIINDGEKEDMIHRLELIFDQEGIRLK